MALTVTSRCRSARRKLKVAPIHLLLPENVDLQMFDGRASIRIDRMLLFRDRLRNSEGDREYAGAKRRHLDKGAEFRRFCN